MTPALSQVNEEGSWLWAKNKGIILQHFIPLGHLANIIKFSKACLLVGKTGVSKKRESHVTLLNLKEYRPWHKGRQTGNYSDE